MAKLTMAEAQRIMAENNGNLDLCGRKDITELPVNLTVGGSLDLSFTPIHELPVNLTVGGSLYLSGTPINELPKDLKIGGWIYGTKNIVNKKDYTQLQNGDYVPSKYIYADDLLTLIKGVHKIGQYTVYVGKIKGRNVVSDGTYYAHCSNVRDGIADIAFKKLKDRGTAQYESLTLDSVIPFEEAVIMYRIVTGACRQGTKDFLNSQKELKKEYTVAEIIEATKGQYGHETFVRFFKNR